MPPIPASSSRVPRVSVVMASYNRGREIRQAIESVLAQDYDDYELIVVDDGSQDATIDIARSFGDQLRVLNQKNRGVGAARNAGIRAARGRYLAYCDADDVQLPFRLRAQAALLDRFTDVAMVFSDFKTYVNGEVLTESHLRARWLGPTVRSFEAELNDAFEEVYTCEELGVPVPEIYGLRRVMKGEVAPLVALMHVAWGCAQMSRIEHVRAVGGHWEEVRAYEDWCLTAELSKRHPLLFMDLPTCLYRVHPDQLTGRPRLNSECYRDVIQHVWRGDSDFYARNRELVDLILGTAYANLGEIDARESKWNDAEENFRKAIAVWPKLKRAYVNLALAAARNRLPMFDSTFLNRVLPPYLASGDEARG